jgi:hypothetical protein
MCLPWAVACQIGTRSSPSGGMMRAFIPKPSLSETDNSAGAESVDFFDLGGSRFRPHVHFAAILPIEGILDLDLDLSWRAFRPRAALHGCAVSLCPGLWLSCSFGARRLADRIISPGKSRRALLFTASLGKLFFGRALAIRHTRATRRCGTRRMQCRLFGTTGGIQRLASSLSSQLRKLGQLKSLAQFPYHVTSWAMHATQSP